MAKRNYSNYSKQKIKPESEEATVIRDIEHVIEDQTVIPEIIEPEATDTKIMGVVSNCTRLNVREEPTTSAKVLTVIEADTEVQIILNEEENGFSKVIIADGREGYCMSKYITIL